MTSQNSTVRWAASIPYSIAGPNMPNVSDENCVCGTGVCSLLISNLLSGDQRQLTVMPMSPGKPPGKSTICTLSL